MRAGSGSKEGLANICPSFICKFYQLGLDHKKGWYNFCAAFLSIKLHKWFYNFPLLIKTVNKSTLLDSVYQFNSRFLILFNKFCHEDRGIKKQECFWRLFWRMFREKSSYVSHKLLEKSWINFLRWEQES